MFPYQIKKVNLKSKLQKEDIKLSVVRMMNAFATYASFITTLITAFYGIIYVTLLKITFQN